MSCEVVEIVRAQRRASSVFSQIVQLEVMAGEPLDVACVRALNAVDLQFKRELLELLGGDECDS